MTQQIDAHQHFWQIARGDYHWMTDEVAAIRHDTLPADLAPHLREHGIAGSVVVQAAATLAETEFLLSLAVETAFIKGVVGWVDLASPEAHDTLRRLAKYRKFKAIRPMLQDIAETDWVLRPEVQANIRALAPLGLRFDALIQPRHLPSLLTLAQAHPNLPIVIDHCAKPLIAGGADAGDAWREDMARLARLPNLYCKLSGLANRGRPRLVCRQSRPDRRPHPEPLRRGSRDLGQRLARAQPRGRLRPMARGHRRAARAAFARRPRPGARRHRPAVLRA